MIDLNKLIEDFFCDDCGLTFSDYHELLDHRKYHTGLLRSTTTEEILLEERCPLCLVKHRGKYKNKCLEEPLHPGGAIGTSKGGLELNHILRCKYYPKCTQKFYQPSEYTSHARKTHDDNEPFVCQQCNYITELYGDMKRHLLAGMHCKICKCYLCPGEENLRFHMVSAHKELRKYECPLCKKIIELAELQKHLRMHFPTPSRTADPNVRLKDSSESKIRSPITCYFCLRNFSKKYRLRKHLLRHQRSECIYCGKKYTEFADLKKHTTGNKCHICAKELSCKKKLHVHVRNHNMVFNCHLCIKGYKSKSALDTHLASIHSVIDDIKTHECSYCSKRFVNLRRFRNHLQKHATGPQKFTCRLCSKDVLKPDFKRHLWHHKIYRCPHCPERYLIETSLTEHLLSTHKKLDILSYNCYCGKRFYTPSTLKIHLEVHLITQD